MLDSARVEIAFGSDSQAAAAERALRSVEGVSEVEFDRSVRRLGVCFSPSKVSIPALLETLRPFADEVRVVSVITPCFHVVSSHP
ncbi:MAG TPA: hypothetical protein VNL14_11180 [Candidatus Acidoferrales bacterium]|nr:hypothetical protein [Candidatus Acidoferrales bacterium]